MVDGLCRSFGFPTLEENLAAFEETSTASTLQLVKRLVAEEQLRHALPLQTAHGQSFRAVAKMLMTHSYKVWYLREALQRALLQRGIFEWQALREQSESPAERQGRLDDFFASWKESPRKFHPQGLPKVPKVASEASTELRSWKDRASRSRCTATTMSSWEWSNDQPSEALMEKAATRVRRRSSRFSLSSPVPLPPPVPIESVGATVATEKFNYLAIFPHLAKRKPMPTRRLFMTEETSPTGSSWKIDEILVHRNQPAESVVAPSELSEARRLLEGEEPAPRRSSVTSRSMSISQSDPTLLSQGPDETFLTGPDTTAIPRGMARQLMALPFEEFQERILKDREADGRDPSPQRLFDRHFRRHLAKPPMPLPSRGGRATTHGLPPLPQKGSNWEPEREHPAPQSPQSATYLRSCTSHFVLPELLPFFTGHSKVLDAENRQLTDKDVLAMSGILRHVHPSVINLGNNILLTDKSMVPFLESVLKQPPGCLLTLQFHRCALGYGSCVKLASLLESEAAKNLRALNLNGIALSLAVQVHLASSIREHDRLRELSLADTQLTSECVQSIAENHQLELLDFGWNSFDAECFAALGLSLSNNVTLRTLSLSRCASCGPYGPPMATFLEHLSGIQNLQDLDISSNLIDHRGALMLEDVLANHQNLKKMNVSDNPLGQLGLRSLLRLLCTPSASLRRFEVNGLSDDAHTDLRDPFFRPSSPGGVYQLDLTQPYHRSILRMLCKTAEHLQLQLSEALSSASGGWPVPEKVDGNWVVQPRGAVKLRFNVEKAMGKGLTQAWDFSSLVKMHVQSLKRRVQQKQIQLLLQFWSLRCQIQEQSLFLNALSKDFFFDAPQILQLCCEREVAAEVIWRLWHCNEPGAHYLSLLQGSPHLSAYVNVLQRSAQLLNFNPQNPSGHYSLDLANCSDFELGQRLLILDRWEGMLRSEMRRRDVGRRPGSCIFDECFNSEELTTGLLDWRWHEKGILDLDYGSGKRLPGEEAPIADEQFRKLCQALLCSQLSPEAKVEALRPVSHHFNFSAFQLRSLCLQTASPSARAELFEIFLQRVVDIQNLKLVLETLEPSRRHPFRLNQCMTFPYIQPEDYDFEFNLKYADHRLACLVVFKLCEAEGWSSVEEGASFCSLGEDAENDEANFWRSSKEASLDNLPLHGIFKGKYLGFLHGNRNLKCRRQLLESFGFWPGAGITEDQVCWCSRPDAPPEIFKLVQWLMLHYPDVNKAFAQIIKKVPNGVQSSGSMTATEFDEAMAALKIQRLDEHGVDAAYRYLSSNDSLTQAMWKKLDPFVVTFRLHAQDFTGFMRSIAGEALEDWWQLIAQTAPSCSTQVGLRQWNDACRTLGFHGDSTLTYQLLEKEGNSISWTDFNHLLQFR